MRLSFRAHVSRAENVHGLSFEWVNFTGVMELSIFHFGVTALGDYFICNIFVLFLHFHMSLTY